MVYTKPPPVPRSTQNAGLSIDYAPANKRCAGEQCSSIVASKGKGGKGGLDRFCCDCRSSITSVASNSFQSVSIPDQGSQGGKVNSKRPYATLSPDGSPWDPKKSRISVRVRDFSAFSKDLESVKRDVLISRIRELISIGQECVSERNLLSSTLKSTEEAFTAYKVAFAGEAFKAFCRLRQGR
jgi:hypothetical protein